MYVLQIITFNNHISGNGVGASSRQKMVICLTAASGCFRSRRFGLFPCLKDWAQNIVSLMWLFVTQVLYLQVIMNHAVAAETPSKSQGSTNK